MKQLFIIIAILLTYSYGFSQITRSAVALDDLGDLCDEGDTLMLFGTVLNIIPNPPKVDKYITGSVYAPEYVKENKVKLTDMKMAFWDSIWFYFASEEYYTKKLLPNYYQEYEKALKQKITEWSESDMIMDDEFQLDYLYSVLFKVFPGQLMKGEDLSLRILVIKSENLFMNSYCSGIIFISTEYLAELKSEKELISGFVDQLTKIVLNKDLEDMRTMGDQSFINRLYSRIPDDFLESEFSAIDTTSAVEFYRNISPALVYTTWKRYYSYKYRESLDVLSKLEKHNLLAIDEYVLKSMLYRKLYNSPAKNLEAMIFLNKAIDESSGELIDLYFEQALIYLRLDNDDLAASSLQKYLEGINGLEALGFDMTEKKKQVRKYLKTLEEGERERD